MASNGNWISELTPVIKQYKNTIHHSIKKTPIQASEKANEKLIYSNLQDKRKKLNPNFQLGRLLKKANEKLIYSNLQDK